MPEKAATDRWRGATLANTKFAPNIKVLVTWTPIRVTTCSGEGLGLFLHATDRWRRGVATRRHGVDDSFAICRLRPSEFGAFAVGRRRVSRKITRPNDPIRTTRHGDIPLKTMTDPTEKTLSKHIRVQPEQWERIERAAQGSALTANQLVVELAIEALDRREWPSTEVEIRIARASLFAAQAIARDLIAKGREQDIREIREFISTIVPDPDARQPSAERDAGQANGVENQ